MCSERRWNSANLVGILDQYIFTVWMLQAQIHDRPDDTPSVLELNIELYGKFAWAHGRCAQDHMSAVVPRVGAGHPPEGGISTG